MLSLDQIKSFYDDESISERNILREYLQYKVLALIAEHTPSLRAGGKGAMGVPRGIPLWSDWGSKPPV